VGQSWSRQLEPPVIATDAPIPEVISPSGLLDGVDTLAQAAERVQEFGAWLRALADAGYELYGPFLGWLRGLQHAPSSVAAA